MLPFRLSCVVDADLGVTVEPLLSQHDDKCGEGTGKTPVQDFSNVDDCGTGASLLRENGSATGWGVPKRDTDDNHELAAHLFEIRSELVLKVDSGSGCNVENKFA